MPAITVKNIKHELYEQLKVAAQAHHRSINNEIISCLERALLPTPILPADRIQKARDLRAIIGSGKIVAKEFVKLNGPYGEGQEGKE